MRKSITEECEGVVISNDDDDDDYIKYEEKDIYHKDQ